MRGRGRWMLLIALLGALLPAGGAGAQTARAERTATVDDARLAGDGPWTSWLGAAAHRTLLFTVDNDGDVTIENPAIVIRESETGHVIATPEIRSLAPGESVTLAVPVRVPALSFGTHAVEGVIIGLDDEVRFRAETSHVPWLLLLAPLLVLIQVTLVGLRDRARRHLAPSITRDEGPDDPAESASPIASRPAEATPPLPGLADVISEELDAAVDDLRRRRHDPDGYTLAVERRARLASERVAARLGLPPDSLPQIAAQMTQALLDDSPDRVASLR